MKFHYETVLHAPGESFSIEIQSGAILDCVYHVHPEFELTFVESARASSVTSSSRSGSRT